MGNVSLRLPLTSVAIGERLPGSRPPYSRQGFALRSRVRGSGEALFSQVGGYRKTIGHHVAAADRRATAAELPPQSKDDVLGDAVPRQQSCGSTRIQ